MWCSRAPSCARRSTGAITFKYLATAAKVLGGPGFSYIGAWRSDNGAVLEFENEIEGIRINGVTVVAW